MNKNVLIAGESWMSHTIHVKGFDSFTTSTYEEGVGWLREAIESGGDTVTFLPNHLAGEQFPLTDSQINCYDVVILSDIGANTLLLPAKTFSHSEQSANRCQLIKNYVMSGGALCMIGGYLTFSGIDGKGMYHATPVADILPVTLYPHDDRCEQPQGIKPEVVAADHPLLKQLPATDWPILLGYNRTRPRPESELVVTINADPLIAAGKFGKGKSAVFTSDCAPHWAPPQFCNWQHYPTLWQNMVNWLSD